MMKNPFQPGDIKQYEREVRSEDIASFDSGTVHAVYSTFALCRDAEWSGRLFVLEMKEEDEEGIGTRLEVVHRAPAFVGQVVRFESRFVEIREQGEILTRFQVWQGDRLIAEGLQGQKILPKQKLEQLFHKLEKCN